MSESTEGDVAIELTTTSSSVSTYISQQVFDKSRTAIPTSTANASYNNKTSNQTSDTSDRNTCTRHRRTPRARSDEPVSPSTYVHQDYTPGFFMR